MAKNIGVNKLTIINVVNTDEPKQYILDLDKNEMFITFTTFNSYEDIGFYPEYLRISCCSSFVYFTLNTDNYDEIRMNLLIVDPYYKDI